MAVSSDGREEFLREVGTSLKERALSVKEELKGNSGSAEEPFLEGMLVAYRRTIALMQEKARACGIDPESLSLHDIDPRRDLRGMKEV